MNCRSSFYIHITNIYIYLLQNRYKRRKKNKERVDKIYNSHLESFKHSFDIFSLLKCYSSSSSSAAVHSPFGESFRVTRFLG